MKRLNLFLALAAAMCTLAACSSISYQAVPFPPQDVEVSSPDVCRFYVIRVSQVTGKSRQLKLYDDALEIGSIGNNEFLCWERPAERTLGRLVYQGPIVDGGDVEGVIDLDGREGGVYYFEVSVRATGKMPIVVRVKPDVGRALVAKARPAGQ